MPTESEKKIYLGFIWMDHQDNSDQKRTGPDDISMIKRLPQWIKLALKIYALPPTQPTIFLSTNIKYLQPLVK